MGFAIVGYFDEKADRFIRLLWKGMADSGVCNYLINSANNPHIKLAMFDSLDVFSAEKIICTLAQQYRKINLQFKSYSFYPNDKPFVCIDVATSIPLLELQVGVCEAFREMESKNSRGYFEPGIWKPDCQLTISFDKAKLSNAMNYLSETHLPINGSMEKIGLIEFHPAKQLFSYKLK